MNYEVFEIISLNKPLFLLTDFFSKVSLCIAEILSHKGRSDDITMPLMVESTHRMDGIGDAHLVFRIEIFGI